jgi:hypothetical protein
VRIKFSLLIALAFALPAITGCEENNYPGTAQQAGSISLLGTGKSVSMLIKMYEGNHGKWPTALSDLVAEGICRREDILYPNTQDLPDRRDFYKIPDKVEWIYIPPREDSANLPLLMGPLPIRSSVGKRLKKTKRIVVMRDSAARFVDEDSAAEILRQIGR